MAKRPDGSYVSNILNTGLQKGLPNGFVDAVFGKDGSLLGYEKDGDFYQVGEKPKAKPQKPKTPLTALEAAEKAAGGSRAKSDLTDLEFRAKGLSEKIVLYKSVDPRRAALVIQLNNLKGDISTLKGKIENVEKAKAKVKDAQALAKAEQKQQDNKDLGVVDTGADDAVRAAKLKVDGKAPRPNTVPAAANFSSVTGQWTLGKDTWDNTGNKATATAITPPKPVTQKTPVATGNQGGSGGGSGSGNTPPEKPKTASQLKAEALSVGDKDFDIPASLFDKVDSLKLLLKQYTNDDPNSKTKWTLEEFRQRIQSDVWFLANGKAFRARWAQKYNYDGLTDDERKLGTTEYAQAIDVIIKKLKTGSYKIGAVIPSEDDLRKAAENLYITNQSENESAILDFLSRRIGKSATMSGGEIRSNYSGDALKNYQELQSVAKANGLKLSDIIPGGGTELTVLTGLANGTLDVNRIKQDVRQKLASSGQPQYVRDLLGQGYDLEQIFSPYRRTMANILEIGDENEIDLNDPVLRSAITDKGDMNLYDFKKVLRQDSRWQYTGQAKEDTSNALMGVLRDFGFQG